MYADGTKNAAPRGARRASKRREGSHPRVDLRGGASVGVATFVVATTRAQAAGRVLAVAAGARLGAVHVRARPGAVEATRALGVDLAGDLAGVGLTLTEHRLIADRVVRHEAARVEVVANRELLEIGRVFELAGRGVAGAGWGLADRRVRPGRRV